MLGRFILSGLLFMFLNSTALALPFSIVPKIPLPKNVPFGGIVYAYYTVINNTNSQRNANHVTYLPKNTVQVTSGGTYSDTCGSSFDLAAQGVPGSSCTLQLAVSGTISATEPNASNHLLICFPGNKTCAGTPFPLNVIQYSPSLRTYQDWINSLASTGYNPVQGNVYLMTNEECPTFINIFNSCFGQNPAAPYIIPQPPIENSYVNPFYATPLNKQGPDRTTNIIYRLGTTDALVTLVSSPPRATYWGYQSYVFTRKGSNYDGITPPRSRTVSPDPDRFELFASVGNNINEELIKNHYIEPWDGTVVAYITTSNQNISNALIADASSYGLDPRSIFVEPLDSNVKTGNDALSDDLVTLIRYAVPASSSAANAWLAQLSTNVLVYKLSNPTSPVVIFGTSQYTAHEINNNENNSSLVNAQQKLATLVRNYLTEKQSQASLMVSSTLTTTVNSQGIPSTGLVGTYCLSFGTNCYGDNQDTSTYAIVNLFNLGAEDTAFIVGVNHSIADLNNNNYLSVDIYNASNESGVASSSQTNPTVVGIDSGNLTGSAQAVLNALRITIPPHDQDLVEHIDKLYLTFIARNCTNSTIAAASAYCINLMGASLIPSNTPIQIAERSYILPGKTTGGNLEHMLYPIVVAALANFNPPSL